MKKDLGRKPQRLLIISHVVHYLSAGVLSAYGPYAREIDIWADLFPEILIASPCRNEPPPPDALPFTRPNIRILPQRETGGDQWRERLAQLAQLPLHMVNLCRALRVADAVHVRCPGNLGLLGAVLGPLFSTRLVAKYAGQWNGFAGEPLTVKLQRALLRSRWWGAPVTVYGAWPNQPAHVVPFFTSMMETPQVEQAARVAAVKQVKLPLRVLYSGRLVSAKRVNALLEGVAQAARQGIPLETVIVGDGPERAALKAQAQALGLATQVKFTGALPFAEVMHWYEWAHCLVLPSQHSEGWPKVIAEAMCHGLLCIAVAHGQVPAMLEGRGLLLPHGTGAEIAQALSAIANQPAHYQMQMQAAAAWAQQFSLEGLREALAGLLSQRWDMPRSAFPLTAAALPNCKLPE